MFPSLLSFLLSTAPVTAEIPDYVHFRFGLRYDLELQDTLSTHLGYSSAFQGASPSSLLQVQQTPSSPPRPISHFVNRQFVPCPGASIEDEAMGESCFSTLLKIHSSLLNVPSWLEAGDTHPVDDAGPSVSSFDFTGVQNRCCTYSCEFSETTHNRHSVNTEYASTTSISDSLNFFGGTCAVPEGF